VQPQWQQRLEANRPRISGRLPDRSKHVDHRAAVGATPWASNPWACRGPRSVEKTDRILPVVATDPAEFVQDLPLLSGLLRR
jgi:hypothetical protein